MSPVLRPALWSALLGAVFSAALATPVYAETPLLAAAPPSANTVPDSGARPLPSGAVRLPGAPAPGTPTGPVVPVPTVSGPLATQIYNREVELATLGEQLLTLRQAKNDALVAVTNTQRDLGLAQAALARAEAAAEATAAEALKQAAALPPGAFGSDLHGLGLLNRLERGQRDSAETTGPAREAARARTAVDVASQAAMAASVQADLTTRQFDTAEKVYQQKVDALLTIKRKNTTQLVEIERQREAAEQQLGGQYGNDSVAGMAAHPRALAALRYALAQRGDPYVWAAEGPDQFDCSGLMWAAYRSKGAGYFGLPRVSRDQYAATRDRQVDRSALLPGDLLFFASGGTPGTIHHVGMYVGGGKMVHAPTTGDVVKVSTVWWSRFYAATRIFGAVPAPQTPGGNKPDDDKPGNGHGNG